jgi:two-component system OmpR family sensor kinase/two-component system sensor histidine kinase BaeS
MRRRFVFRFVFLLGLFLVAVVAVNVLVFHGTGAGHRRFVPFGVVFLLLLGGLALLRGIRGFARPVGDVMEAADRVAEGDYATRVPERGPREIRRLGRSFNQMTERLQTNEERRRNLLADVTHELRTPLAVMQANLEGLMDGVYPADPAHLALILDETKMMSRLLDDLQTLSTAEAGALRLHRELVEPGTLVDEAVAGFRTAAADAGVSVEGRVADGLPPISVDRLRIVEVFTNLLSNALRHTPRGGSVVVDAASDADDSVTFTVSDTGRGIPADELDHVFDRFAKAHDSRGAGLGLAIAKSLILAHRGEIAVTSPRGQGTTVRFSLPTTEADRPGSV